MNSTQGSIGNSTIPRPSADAWCVYECDGSNNPIILDSYGVSTVTRISAGRHRVFFSNPERFVSGAYVGLAQQEIGNFPGGYGTSRIHGTTQSYLSRATGVSASCDILTVGYVTPGSTNPSFLADSSNSSKVRTNTAFFCLRNDSDLYKHHRNLISTSENFNSIAWTKYLSTVVLAPVNVPVPCELESDTKVWKFVPAFSTLGGGAWSSMTSSFTTQMITNSYYTMSAYVKTGDPGNITGSLGIYGSASPVDPNATSAADTLTAMYMTNPPSISSVATPGSNGSNNFAGITSAIRWADDDWYRISMTWQWKGALTTNAQCRFFGGGITLGSGDGYSGIYVAGLQIDQGSFPMKYVKTTAAVAAFGNQDRLINFSPGSAGLGQDSRQNLLTYSQDFTNAAWQNYSIRLGVSAGGYTAPDGTTTAMKLYELNPIGGSTINYKSLGQVVPSATAERSWIFSIHAKAAERKYFAFAESSYASLGRCVVDLTTGKVTQNTNSNKIVVNSVGNGWQRIMICGNTPKNVIGNAVFGFSPNPGATVGMSGEVNGGYGPSYHGVSGSGILIWGAQLERGMVYSPYASTTSAAVGTVSARVAGLTYQSTPKQIQNAREATAWGTIVIPAGSSASTVTAYLEGEQGCSRVVARNGSVFDVYFTKPMDASTYCVITSTEQEAVIETEAGVGFANSIPPTDEFVLTQLQNEEDGEDSQRKRESFTLTCRRQAPSTDGGNTINGFTKQSIHFQRGRMHRIHFMVFGGRTIRGTS